jgi:hypothetical protein
MPPLTPPSLSPLIFASFTPAFHAADYASSPLADYAMLFAIAAIAAFAILLR